jgi:hypothetical protein
MPALFVMCNLEPPAARFRYSAGRQDRATTTIRHARVCPGHLRDTNEDKWVFWGSRCPE